MQGILRGAGYGAVGAVSGVMYATGNIVGATAVSSLGNSTMDLISGHSLREAASSAALGVTTAPIGGAISSEVSMAMGPLLNGIKGPAIRMMIDRGVSQAVGAQVVGTGMGLMMGQNLGEAAGHALPNSLVAFVAGGAGGYVEGVQWAKAMEQNAITRRFSETIEKVQTVTVNTKLALRWKGL